jgi:hypothetical protein
LHSLVNILFRKVFYKIETFATILIFSKSGLAVGLPVPFIGLLVLLAAFFVFRQKSGLI